MTGSDYVARRRISDREDETLAAVGETCDRVPAEALGWLEACGAIVSASAVADDADDEGDLDG